MYRDNSISIEDLKDLIGTQSIFIIINGEYYTLKDDENDEEEKRKG